MENIQCLWSLDLFFFFKKKKEYEYNLSGMDWL
jgi:hypothetical protein